jgi:hypothetical protein
MNKQLEHNSSTLRNKSRRVHHRLQLERCFCVYSKQNIQVFQFHRLFDFKREIKIQRDFISRFLLMKICQRIFLREIVMETGQFTPSQWLECFLFC